VPIIAQDNVRKRLETGGELGNGGTIHRDLRPAPKDALPMITLDHDVTVHFNGEDIRALHIPSGHTDGDSVIYFPKSNAVHMGDDFVTYGFPFIDIDGGGSIDGMISGVETTIAQLPPGVKIIPGHGNVSTLAEVRDCLKMLKDTRATAKAAFDKNMRLAEMKRQKILDPRKKYSGDFVSEDIFLETLYNWLTGQKNGMFVRHN
jgi:cyclase